MVARRKISRPLRDLSPRILYEVAHLYVVEGLKANRIAQHLKAKYPFEYDSFGLNNERIVSILGVAIKEGLLLLQPPRERTIEGDIELKFGSGWGSRDDAAVRQKVIRVAHVGAGAVSPPPDPGTSGDFIEFSVPGHVADVAAREILDLIPSIGAGINEDRPVRIGLGAGITARHVVQRLGHLLRHTNMELPRLALHALTPGFSLVPHESPDTYFRFFEGIDGKAIDFYGLSMPPFMPTEGADWLLSEPEYKKARELAQEIDIVITSLASAEDEHGMLRCYLDQHHPAVAAKLRQSGWRGDVQFCPYSSEEPLRPTKSVQAVSLLGLDDLAHIAGQPHKYVLLIACPCNQCGRPKQDAVMPLLSGGLTNIWTHFFTDVETGRAIAPRPDGEGE